MRCWLFYRRYFRMSQIWFTGESSCPSFTPNRFKADLCNICNSKVYFLQKIQLKIYLKGLSHEIRSA